ncbi:hypothetical protein QBC41DRAFT_368455 [Cercophora samala]|uniref:Uncharacterized protein n=1 Tax=Cercophora samala TaxID=330535 RepID=A0AA39YZY3_9PEZI|nr:hypothetical protein QBC41DRAFT_368455 [Cercophora samala]
MEGGMTINDFVTSRTKTQAEKARMMNGQNWRSDGRAGPRRQTVLGRSSTTEPVKAQKPSSSLSSTQSPKDQIYELHQDLKLLGQLQAWYEVNHDSVQSTGAHSKPAASLLDPLDEEIYKLQRLRHRIAFKLHTTTIAQNGPSDKGRSVDDTPSTTVKVSDLLQRKWDAPHLDRKVLHLVLAKGGYKPKPNSRVSSGVDLKPSDSDFFELCDAIENQLKNLPKPSRPPPPPRKTSIKQAQPLTFGVQPPCSAFVFEKIESSVAGRYTPPPPRSVRGPAATTTMTTTTATTTSKPPFPPVKPIQPFRLSQKTLADDQKSCVEPTEDRIRSMEGARERLKALMRIEDLADLPEENLWKRSDTDARRESEAKWKKHNIPTSFFTPAPGMITPYSSTKDYKWFDHEATKRPTPRLSMLRNEIQVEPDTSVIYVRSPGAPKLPSGILSESQSGVRLSPKASPLPSASGGAPARDQFVASAYANRASRLAYTGSKASRHPVAGLKNTPIPEPEPEPIQPLKPTPMYKKNESNSTSRTQLSTTPTSTPRPPSPFKSAESASGSDSEPDWESLSTLDSLFSYCEHCGIEHGDFDNLSFYGESDFDDSGVELEEDEEDGLLITNRRDQLIEENDDGEGLNVKRGYFLEKLNKIVNQTLEDREAIAEWDDDFTEEAEEKEDEGFCII